MLNSGLRAAGAPDFWTMKRDYVAKLTLRQQTGGAMLAVVAAVIALATYIPIIGAFLFLAAPVPIVLSTLRHGIKVGILTALLCTILLFVFMGPGQAILFFVASGSQGVLIGSLVRWKPNPLRLMLTGMIATVALTIFSVHFGAYMMGLSEPLQDMKQAMDMTMKQTKKLMSMMGPLPPEQQKMQDEMMDQQKKVMDALLSVPLFFFVIAAFGFVFNYYVNKWVLHRLDEELPDLPAFRDWRMPSWLGLLLILSVLAMPIKDANSLFANPLYFNVFMIMRMAFFLVGLAAVTNYFHKKNFPLGLRVPAYLLLVLPLQGITFIIGLADTIGGWRDPRLMALREERQKGTDGDGNGGAGGAGDGAGSEAAGEAADAAGAEKEEKRTASAASAASATSSKKKKKKKKRKK